MGFQLGAPVARARLAGKFLRRHLRR
jgi:hypothetical protein